MGVSHERRTPVLRPPAGCWWQRGSGVLSRTSHCCSAETKRGQIHGRILMVKLPVHISGAPRAATHCMSDHSLTLSLSLTHTNTRSRTVSLSLTHTHSLTLSLSLSHTQKHTLSLCLSSAAALGGGVVSYGRGTPERLGSSYGRGTPVPGLRC